MSLSGNDNWVCGLPSMPCRTIERAVQRAAWGDTIHLDGTGTERQPFNCPGTRPDVPGIHVTTSLSVIGFSSAAHVSCTSGILFEEPTGRERMLVAFSGIEFEETSLIFRNCSAQVVGCSFRGQLKDSAIYFQAGGISRVVSLAIRNSAFTSNSLGISADFHGNVGDLGVTIHLQNTRFVGNGQAEGSPGAAGILLRNSSRTRGVLRVQVSCSDVSFVENQGSFMKIEFAAAITNESYTNVKFSRNAIQRVRSQRGSRAGPRSLYYARTTASHITFTSARCENNTNARCVDISSPQLALKIRGSLFSGQILSSDNGGALLIGRPAELVNLSIENSLFHNNTAQSGGCVYIDDQSGTVNLDVSNVTFSQCRAMVQGSAMVVGGIQSRNPSTTAGVRHLLASMTNIKVLNNSIPKRWGRIKFGAICWYVRRSGLINFDHVHWIGNSGVGCPALLVGITQGRAWITINNSLLVDNEGNFGNLCTASLVSDAGNTAILNTQIINARHNGMALDSSFQIGIQNVTIDSARYAALEVGSWLWKSRPYSNVTVSIKDCLLNYNRVNVMLKLYPSKNVTITIKDSIFSGPLPKSWSRWRKRIYSFMIIFPISEEENPSDAQILLDNVTVDSLAAFLVSVKRENTSVNMQVRRSTFKNCTILCLHKRGQCGPGNQQFGGAVTILLGPDRNTVSGCTSRRAKSNTHPRWEYVSRITFEDTVFEANEGLKAGAVYVENGQTTFRRCSFKDNFAVERGGHVTLAPGSARVDLISSTFSQTKSVSRPERKVQGPQFLQFLFSESFAPINITKTNMSSFGIFSDNQKTVLDIAQGGYVFIDSASRIKCCVGSRLVMENLTHLTRMTSPSTRTCNVNVTVLRYSCTGCHSGMYSLQAGQTSGFFVQEGFQCLMCPYGAECITWNIVAKSSFWGYLVQQDPPALNFTPCPEEYCSPPRDPPPSVYNGCHGNRMGDLCGRCRHGYTESLFTTECRLEQDCSPKWFWFGAVTTVVCLSLLLLNKPPLFAVLYRHLFWFKQGNLQKRDFEEDLSPSQHSDSGYLKVTFYYYQVAELLVVGPVPEVVRHIPFVLPVLGLFKLQVQSFDEGVGCPFVGLTAVTKELFLSLGPFAVLACVFTIYAIHRLVNFVRRKDRPDFIHYLAVALETLLLGYERLAETALKLLHCIPLGAERRLFCDGTVVCWQWWQAAPLVFLLVFLVPFIGVLYWGSLLLHARRISFRQFLGACVLPVPFLFYWAVCCLTGRLKERAADERVGGEVLEVLHGPFRAPSDGEQGSLYWESVLTGRRFILLSMGAFLVDPMMRLACMTGACVLMAFHHVIKRPYRELRANRVETASLLLLVLIGVVNLARASFQSAGTDPQGPSREYFVAFRWLEVTCLALAPCLVVLLAISTLLSQLVRLLLFLFSWSAKNFKEFRRGRLAGEGTPLLYEENSEGQAAREGRRETEAERSAENY